MSVCVPPVTSLSSRCAQPAFPDSRGSAGPSVDVRSSSKTASPPTKRARVARVARTLSKDAQELIIACYQTASSSSKHGRAREVVADMLGGTVGASTISKVWAAHKQRVAEAIKQGKDESTVRVPDAAPDVRQRSTKYDGRHLTYVAHCINTMVYEQPLEELPSVRSMYEKVMEMRLEFARRHHCSQTGVFNFSHGTFHKMLKQLGYVHVTDEDDRSARKNQEHVLQMRTEYLKQIARLRAKGYVILYQDETWVNKNTTKKKSWVLKGDGNVVAAPGGAQLQLPSVLRSGGQKKPIGKGGRAIVIGIGSSQHGTIGELLKVFVGKKAGKTDDYHKEMNATLFEEWFDEVLKWIASNLPDQKVAVVIDNAKYHSRAYPHTMVPTMSKRKDEIITWMRSNREVPPQLLPGYIEPQEVNMRRLAALEAKVAFEYVEPHVGPDDPLPSYSQYDKLTKKQLLASIQPRSKKYVIDDRSRKAGVELVRLPPYHCEFNPIELVWGHAKGAVAKRNVTYNLKSAMSIMKEECLKCDAEYWKKVEIHAIKEEQKVLAGDVVLRAMVERAANSARSGDDLIIVFSASSESEDESDSDSEDDSIE